MCDNDVKRERDSVQIDAETQLPEAKRRKYDSAAKEAVLDDLLLSEIIALFNKKVCSKHVKRFICCECNKIYSGGYYTFNETEVAENCYCDNCVKDCDGCGSVYCKALAYEHTKCSSNDDDDDDDKTHKATTSPKKEK